MLTLIWDVTAVAHSQIPVTRDRELTIRDAVIAYLTKNRNMFSSVKLLRISMDSRSHPITKNRTAREAAMARDIW